MKTLVRQFNFPTLIRCGRGAAEEIPDHLQSEGFKRPLVVTDTFSATLHFFQELIQQLNTRKIQPDVFIINNPTLSEEVIRSASDRYKIGPMDCILAVGSALAMSVGRAVALTHHHPGALSQYDDAHGGEKNITQAIPHFICVPIAGTGNEVSRSIDLREVQSNRKLILFSPRLMAKVVFADPAATLDLPATRIREWTLESYAILLEAWFSIMNHPICEGIACEGLSILLESDEVVPEVPNVSAHQRLMMASLMSGIARQKGLGPLYAVANALSVYCGCSLAAAFSILLPSTFKFTSDANRNKLHKLARRLNWREKTDNAIGNKLISWAMQLGLPGRLSEVGVHAADLEMISDLAWSDPIHADGPRQITRSEIRTILAENL